jgi:hypothetical protein
MDVGKINLSLIKVKGRRKAEPWYSEHMAHMGISLQ